MREWSIPTNGPLSLQIAADARIVTPNYVDDQIWELSLGGGEPPAISLHTTYGLRARSMRIFPGFSWGQARVTDPAQFSSPPMVRQFLPNYLKVDFAPLTDLYVQMECWAADSYLMAGRFSFQNVGAVEKDLLLRLHVVLHPGEKPQTIGGSILEGVNVLAGRTGSIAPVIFLSGGASVEHTAHPALMVTQTLHPGDRKTWIWVHAGLREHDASFEAARDLIARPWDSEIARIELVNASVVDIRTGDSDWDAALAMAQKVSLGCYVGPTRRLPHASFVLTRTPDKGYSRQGDGTDYNWQWDGQTATHAYINLPQVLPIDPELAKGVIHNFLAIQSTNGSIDWKPGLGGQRNGALSIPLLATLAWKIFKHTEDKQFLKRVLPSLIEFFEAWFTREHDRDQDGHPEWDHTVHMGFDDNPSFVGWRRWAQRLDVTKAETPDLAAYLYKECQSLIEMIGLLGWQEAEAELKTRATRLHEAIESSWSDKTSSYHYVDRDVHKSVAGSVLGKGEGQFILEVQREFDPPVRVLVHSSGAEGLSHAVKVFIHGRGRRQRRRPERLTERHFQWFWEFGAATSDKTYTEIERIEVRGLSDEFETELYVADYTRQDQSLLIPLWAGVPSPERAERLVRRTLLDTKRYWRQYGIPICSAMDSAYAADNRQGAGGVWMLWNTMLGEALVDYGYVEEAAELVGRLMGAVIHSLRVDKSFREAYNADRLEGVGERGHLSGVAPVDLFLYTLGVRLISPHKVWLRPGNPFPWSVVVNWQGLLLECLKDRTVVTFPDGQQIEVVGDESQVVEQLLSRGEGER